MTLHSKANAVQVDEELSSLPDHSQDGVSAWVWVIWTAGLLFSIYQFVLRTSLGVMGPQLMERFAIDATEFSLLGSTFYFGYASLQIPVGFLLDRYGPARVLPYFIGFCVMGFCVFSYFTSWEFILVGRLLTGIGSAAAFISILKITRLIFPDNWFARMVGITSSIGLFGAVFGGYPVGVLMHGNTLSNVLSILSITGICLALGVITILTAKKSAPHLKSHHFKGSQEKSAIAQFVEAVSMIVSNKSLIIMIVATSLMTSALYTFADSWGPMFLMNFHHVSPDIASTSVSVIYVGMTIGATVLAFLGDRFQITQLIVILCGFLTAGILSILIAVPELPSFIILPMLFIFGMCASMQLLIFGTVLGMLPARIGGVAAGILNMSIMMIGSAFSIFVLGEILDSFWTGETNEAGVRVYTAVAYQMAFGAIVVLVLIGAFSLMFLNLRSKYKRKSHASLSI